MTVTNTETKTQDFLISVNFSTLVQLPPGRWYLDDDNV